jgi:hypothetical protein
MALNPEIVTNILQTELSANLVENWHQKDELLDAIKQKANERATSPSSFVDWLIKQHFFRLKTGVELYDYKIELLDKLSSADLTIIPVELKTATHYILLIESGKMFVEQFKDFTRLLAKNHYGMSTQNIKFKHISCPPEAAQFVKLLNKHTASVLHNLSLDDLITINEAVTKNPGLASKLVVVMTGGTTTSEHEKFYSLLSKQGLMVIQKPFPSYEEVVRVVLGVV